MSSDPQGDLAALVVEAAPNAIVMVDKSGKIVLANGQAGKLFGDTQEELLKKPVEILIPHRYRESHASSTTGFFRNPSPRMLGAGRELFGLRKDGTEVPVEIGLNPIQAPDGPLVLAAIVDITERREAEAHQQRLLEQEFQNRKVGEANRLKSEFLAHISHELRSPLNAILGFAELLYDGKVKKASETKEYLGDILQSARYLQGVINDVLDLAKIESGKFQLFPKSVEVPAMVKETADNVRKMAEEAEIRIDTEVDPAVMQVELDPGRLKQILYNFLSNALKFTPRGGKVGVRVLAEGVRDFRVEVRDSGVGIRQEDQKRLFQQFQQLDPPVSKQYPGTGLGLYITRKIVEAHGGQVGVASEFGKGSVFFAVLPRKSPAQDTL